MSLHSNNMCTASDKSMPLLRRLKLLLESRNVRIDVQCIPSAFNLHADNLSRTWDPGDPQLSRAALLLMHGWFSKDPILPTFIY